MTSLPTELKSVLNRWRLRLFSRLVHFVYSRHRHVRHVQLSFTSVARQRHKKERRNNAKKRQNVKLHYNCFLFIFLSFTASAPKQPWSAFSLCAEWIRIVPSKLLLFLRGNSLPARSSRSWKIWKIRCRFYQYSPSTFLDFHLPQISTKQEISWKPVFPTRYCAPVKQVTHHP